MAGKNELLKALADYRAIVHELDAQRQLIDLDTRTRDDVKASEREAAMWERAPRVREIRERAVNAAEQMRADLQARYRRESAERLQDGGYQSSLNATASALRAGAIRNPADIEAISETFGNDPVALGMLRPLAAEHGLTIPGSEDNRSKNLESLDQVRAGVDTFLDTDHWRLDDWRDYAERALLGIGSYLDGCDDDGARG